MLEGVATVQQQDPCSSVGSSLSPLWDSPSLLCGILVSLWDPLSAVGSSLHCGMDSCFSASQEQSTPDRTPPRSPGSTTFMTYPEEQKNFLAERIKLWDIFRFNKLSGGGKGKSGFFSCVFSNIKITERFL